MQDTKVKTKALDQGNCSTVRLGGKEAGVKTTSPRTGTGYEAGDADEFARQNEVHEVSASQVKPGVVSGKFTSLPGETCPPGGGARERDRSTVRGNPHGERAGVSRGRSSAGYEPGVGVHLKWGAPNEPDGLTQARRTELIETAETATTCQLRLVRSCAAETDRSQRGDLRRSPLVARKQTKPTTKVSANPENEGATRSEPPDTDPYVRWCGGRRLITSGYPIGLRFQK